MAKDQWVGKRMSVTNLSLDARNPRLGRNAAALSQREILQYLFDHDKAFEIAQSIATREFFENEPLLAISEGVQHVVIEGNRRLAALKALRDPSLLSEKDKKRVARLAESMTDIAAITTVPVIIAPDRRHTDRQVAGRHVGTPVLAWEAENRANFILDKLVEGYTNDTLRDELGFTEADIQGARQTRAIADMARALDLPPALKAKLDSPRANVLTTLERVFESKVGRAFLGVEPDLALGLRGTVPKEEFLKGFNRLVRDVASGTLSSRKLNSADDMKTVFAKWPASDRPARKRGSFTPDEVVGRHGKAVARGGVDRPSTRRSKRVGQSVVPRSFKIRQGGDRLIDIRGELVSLKRDRFPNAGAVLLRVFFELSAIEYLKRTGGYQAIVARLGGEKNLQFGAPKVSQMTKDLIAVAKKHLSAHDATGVEKALTYNAAAPFTLTDLHAFVHSPKDVPTARDIQQFWGRIEPLLTLMLSHDENEK